MNGKELTSKLAELDTRDFVNIGRLKPHSQNTNTRLLLLEMGVHLMDDAEMRAFRECHGKATKMRAEKVFRENARRAESLRRGLDEAVKKVKDRLVILTPGQENMTVEGVKLLWECPRCGEKQEADLSKTEDDPTFLKVNGKYLMVRRRCGNSPPQRVTPADKLLLSEPGAMRMSETSMSRRDVGFVSMPPGWNSAAVIRLARGDTINFEFGCGKCNFRNREIKVAVR